ncbi:MAG: hypothetical protein QOI04_356 [Verrucomicrobiota bacterium]
MSELINDGSSWRSVVVILLFVLAINILSMPAERYAGDADATRVQAFTLLEIGEWNVTPQIAQIFGERGQYFYENGNGKWYSKYGVLNTLIYLPALWLDKMTLDDEARSSAGSVFALNLTNLVFSIATAAYLVLLARRYTKRAALIAIFVLASLYTTFWWNYLRTQTFEIYQTLFLLAFYYHFVTALSFYRQATNRRRDLHLLLAAIYFGALCLCKSVYVVLLPAIVAMLCRVELAPSMSIYGASTHDSSSREKRFRRLPRQLLFFWLPIVILLSILAFTNWIRFGSPFATGYTQWEKERQLFKLANLFPALWGFCFSSRHSIFLHYPVLLFALAGWPIFFTKHKLDALAIILMSASLLLVNSTFSNWRGESSYGPRYLLPVLPLLGLPFIDYISWIATLSNKLARAMLTAGTSAILAYSLLLQVSVNTMPFFFSHKLRNILDDRRLSKPAIYLNSHHIGSINLAFLLFRSGHDSSFGRNFVSHLSSSERARLDALNKSLFANYYWFPNLPSAKSK